MGEIDPRQQGNMFKPKKKRDWGMLFVFISSIIYLIAGPIFIVHNLFAPGIVISIFGLLLVVLSLIIFYFDVKNTKQPIILMCSLFFSGLSLGLAGFLIGDFAEWSSLNTLLLIYGVVSILLGVFVTAMYFGSK